MNQMFIPEKIKVGYQKREDTYTKKLGYVIYFDAKGVLRKEKSWQTWRDSKIQDDEFDNKPVEGFVINRNGGGVRASYGWDARHEFVRVFDPRGFEFEISIANLLYILQESNSIKGKGLEGEFVYAWAGTTLCLLPVGSEEHKKCTGFTSLQGLDIKPSDLVPGHIYETKRQQKLMYMGKFKWYSHRWESTRGTRSRADVSVQKGTKKHIFINPDEKDSISVLGDAKTIARDLSTAVDENFASKMDNLIKDPHLYKGIALHTEPINPKIKKDGEVNYHSRYGHVEGHMYQKVSENKFVAVQINAEIKYDKNSKYVLEGYTMYNSYIYEIQKRDDGFAIDREYQSQERHGFSMFGQQEKKKLFTEEQITGMTFDNIFVELENGSKIQLEKYMYL